MNPTSQPRLQWLLFLKLFCVSLFLHFHTSYGDVGTAALYSPPYLHTACYGSDASQFPSSNLFAAAGDRIWDNGAVCGRQYLVRCITSTSTPDACNQNQTILIKIVDYMGRPPFALSTYNTTMVLSNTAFGSIANSSTASSYINIEFEQIHGEDVPLGRGPVPPSDPNPITDDASSQP
ncbi:EG45-like domain containing protein [Castanea sativa]|uniref:EG45-like domain containing protein n=1 Tax=Castanea sativa TaxID=21020 RepID=UPI003F64EEBA